MANEAWKSFLRGRIAQEQGNAEEASKLIGDALAVEPGNSSFRKAQAFALEAQKRGTEAGDLRIAAAYEAVAQRLSGANDRPEAWIDELQALQRQLDSGQVSVVW
ncbi:MAG: hypothetical protein QOI95_3102 [Acidimicrobiaceae bacterium]|jgi:hypothetical protein